MAKKISRVGKTVRKLTSVPLKRSAERNSERSSAQNLKNASKQGSSVSHKNDSVANVRSSASSALSSAASSNIRSTIRSDANADARSEMHSTSPLPLSFKEKNVLEFLEGYLAAKGVSPTYQEICVHFGFASFNSVQRYLKQLESKGYIRLPWANQKRAIALLHPASSLRSAVLESRDESAASIAPDSLTPALLPSESLSLPLLGRVAAGAPIEAVEHNEFIDVPASLVRYADRTYALRVQGQSMIDDGIFDGDVILVQRQSTAQNGEIVVAMIGEEATVKRFYSHRGTENIPQAALKSFFERRRGESGIDESENESDDAFAENAALSLIELRPANSSLSPMWYDPSELQLRGVVVGLIRRFMS